jgi:CheY-like chemotaxis protein
MSKTPYSAFRKSSSTPLLSQQPEETGLDIHLDFDLDLVEPAKPSPVRLPPRLLQKTVEEVSDPLSSTIPLSVLRTANNVKRRVLVVSADADERMYLRARLALAKLTSLVEASTTIQAQAELNKYPYVLVMVNLDDPVIDGIALVRELHFQHPNVPCVGTLSINGPTGAPATGKGSRQDVICRAVEAGFKMVLDKPMAPKVLVELFKLVQKR